MPFRRKLSLLLFFLLCFDSATAQVVVANAKTPVIVFTLHPTNHLHNSFCREHLKIFPYQLQRAWDRLVYSGIGQAPQRVNDVREMREKVSQTPGAIGYLPEDPKEAGIRVIEIIPAK